jgi:UDP-N-acetylglucosamine acyltransferase
MVQGGCKTTKEIPPYVIAAREPMTYCGINLVGLRRRGFTREQIDAIHQAYRFIYQSGLNTTMALARIKEEMEMTPEIEYIVSFVEGAKRGIIKYED